jgi:hypothetical protein
MPSLARGECVLLSPVQVLAVANQGWLVSQDERHLQDHLESYDLAIVYLNFLILDPCTFDILQRLVGAFDTLKDCVFKALLADTADFADACNGHDQSFTVGRQADMTSGEVEVPYFAGIAGQSFGTAMPR